MAAISVGICFSQKKNAIIMIIEIISGARTMGDDHPLDEPEVKAKINRTNATVNRYVSGEL